MLKLSALTIENFGPFKGQQTIEFDKEDGVSLVYGENMRGKTSLINAVRYALFGKVISRGAREIALHQIGNWESAQDGVFASRLF